MRRQGFGDTSIAAEIRADGQCGPGHFYHYFKSKEELGYAVLKLQFEDFAERGLVALRLRTVASLRPQSRPYQTGMNAPCVLARPRSAE